MTRILVVANQTLGCPELDEVLDEYVARPSTAMHLVAPVTAIEGEHQWDYPAVDRHIPAPEQIAHALAVGRLEHAVSQLRSRGVDVAGEVVDNDPVGRVRELLAESGFDEVVVCTLPERLSRWLRMDLPHMLRRATELPVRHVPGSAGPSL